MSCLLTRDPHLQSQIFNQRLPLLPMVVNLSYLNKKSSLQFDRTWYYGLFFRGRLLVATEDIPPGEIIIVETPYSSILLPEYYQSHCQSCYMRVKAPIPCWFCAKVESTRSCIYLEKFFRWHKEYWKRHFPSEIIFMCVGRCVSALISAELKPGSGSIKWNANS